MNFFSAEDTERSATSWAAAREKLVAERVYYGTALPALVPNPLLS